MKKIIHPLILLAGSFNASIVIAAAAAAAAVSGDIVLVLVSSVSDGAGSRVVPVCIALCNFIFVMRKFQVDSATVNVKVLSKNSAKWNE